MHANSSPAAKIIERMQVPGWPHFYVLGCFEIRVTSYNQQVRALNLVHALRKVGLPDNARIAVVGAGASGLTAAAAAAIWGRRNDGQHGWKVVVLDDRPDILALIGHGSARWLHPHIYEWPSQGSETQDAELCIMDWRTGTAGTVIDSLGLA
jgi:threonine dehydrogenase-like Zn-dependent dehydrogenase